MLPSKFEINSWVHHCVHGNGQILAKELIHPPSNMWRYTVLFTKYTSKHSFIFEHDLIFADMYTEPKFKIGDRIRSEIYGNGTILESISKKENENCPVYFYYKIQFHNYVQNPIVMYELDLKLVKPKPLKVKTTELIRRAIDLHIKLFVGLNSDQIQLSVRYSDRNHLQVSCDEALFNYDETVFTGVNPTPDSLRLIGDGKTINEALVNLIKAYKSKHARK